LIDESRPPKPVIWNGKEYDSTISLSRDLNVTPTTIRNWLKLGYRSTEDVKNRRK
jgi:hypothetical protein